MKYRILLLFFLCSQGFLCFAQSTNLSSFPEPVRATTSIEAIIARLDSLQIGFNDLQRTNDEFRTIMERKQDGYFIKLLMVLGAALVSAYCFILILQRIIAKFSEARYKSKMERILEQQRQSTELVRVNQLEILKSQAEVIFRMKEIEARLARLNREVLDVEAAKQRKPKGPGLLSRLMFWKKDKAPEAV